ncbi:MAG: tRNA (adenosine(37)-N6)-threonylcarbamoyltransferase complex transferase subunit TsaD [Candidatus Nucleicultricaceae bacterium]
MIVLGIETSCDETAAAVVDSNRTILSNVLHSQLYTHRPFGGVVPEIAARHHLDVLPDIIKEALKKANVSFEDLDGIAATTGPGLVGGVMIGMMMAKTLSAYHKKPFLAINHLAGHALTVRLTDGVEFPYLLLLVSGGHTQLLIVHKHDDFELLGSTLDDAVGEAFDKTAKLLDLPYPGGPNIEILARDGDPDRFELPRPLLKDPTRPFTFSLSGLKTAVRTLVLERSPLSSEDKANIAASFQKTISMILANRSSKALAYAKTSLPHLKGFVVAGGVAANQSIRDTLSKIAHEYHVPFYAPPLSLCTDNAAFIAWTGIEKLNNQQYDCLAIGARPRWPLVDLKKGTS